MIKLDQILGLQQPIGCHLLGENLSFATELCDCQPSLRSPSTIGVDLEERL